MSQEAACETCGKHVGNMMCLICADCCEKDHPETNKISNEEITRLRDNANNIFSDIDQTVSENYDQDMPNANHIADVKKIEKTKITYSVKMFANHMSGLVSNIIGSININKDRAWGSIPVFDGYIYEKLGKILYELGLNIEDPEVRKRLKYP